MYIMYKTRGIRVGEYSLAVAENHFQENRQRKIRRQAMNAGNFCKRRANSLSLSLSLPLSALRYHRRNGDLRRVNSNEKSAILSNRLWASDLFLRSEESSYSVSWRWGDLITLSFDSMTVLQIMIPWNVSRARESYTDRMQCKVK